MNTTRTPHPRPPATFDAVLFDMDDTLVNTEHLWFEAGRDFTLGLGIDLPGTALDELHGLDLDAAPRLLPEAYGLRLPVGSPASAARPVTTRPPASAA
jgi:beta-phosphoglucomutase-like phosphatase (HAD superfamily)